MTDQHRSNAAPEAPILHYHSTPTGDASSAAAVGVVGLRLFGIYLMLQFLNIFGIVASQVWSPYQQSVRLRSWWAQWAYVVTGSSTNILFAIVGAVLFWRARPLARRMFGDLPHSQTPLTEGAALAVLIAAMGLYIAAESLPPLIVEGANIWFGSLHEQWRMSTLWKAAIRLVVGVLLCVFASRISRFWSSR
jgi:hypothetical protein